MTAPPDGLLATGTSWRTGIPTLLHTTPDGAERSWPLPIGQSIGWRVHGPRRCIGIWLPEIKQRRPCPQDSTLPSGAAGGQCSECAAADPGRALARNLTDDPRPFSLYLAWFGDHQLKVGLTATERGSDRLAEQGALAFTWLGRGTFRAARRAEQAVAVTGLAHERIPRRRKLATWWQPDVLASSRVQLQATHGELTGSVDWPPDLQPEPCDIQNLTHLYGLSIPLPANTEEITALADDSVLAGRLTCLVGHEAVITAAEQPFLVDLRLLVGWSIAPTSSPLTGVTSLPFDQLKSDAQGTLF